MKKQADETFSKGIVLEKGAEFEKAKAIYEDLFRHFADEAVLRKIRIRTEDIDDLIEEKAIYQRIGENAKRVLTEIGNNIIENQSFTDLLMEADAMDFRQ
jgi:trimethylamine--corrinoid protein Co-methyltransferase